MNLKHILDVNEDGMLSAEDIAALRDQQARNAAERYHKHLAVPFARSVLAGLATFILVNRTIHYLWLYQFDKALGLSIWTENTAVDFSVMASAIVFSIWLMRELYNNSEGPKNRAVEAAYDRGYEQAANEYEAQITTLEADLRAAQRRDGGAERNHTVDRYFKLLTWYLEELYGEGRTAREVFKRTYGVTDGEWRNLRNRFVALGIMTENRQSLVTRAEAFQRVNKQKDTINDQLDDNRVAAL